MMAYGSYAPFYRGGYYNLVQSPSQPIYQPIAENNAQYMQAYQNGVQGNPQPQNGFIWVLNENEALARFVAPGDVEITWDKTNPTIYIKSVNAQGVPSMRVLDFVERTQAPQGAKPQPVQFVTVETFNALRGELETVKCTLAQMQEKTSEVE